MQSIGLHVPGVCVRPETPEAVAVISAHSPPPQDGPRRVRLRVCKEAFVFVERPGAIFKFLQGDLNAAPGRAGGGGLVFQGSGPWRVLAVHGVPLSPLCVVYGCNILYSDIRDYVTSSDVARRGRNKHRK